MPTQADYAGCVVLCVLVFAATQALTWNSGTQRSLRGAAAALVVLVLVAGGFATRAAGQRA